MRPPPHHLNPRRPATRAIPAGPQPSQPPPPQRPPQLLCFGSLHPSLLAPGSHLPLYPSSPCRPPAATARAAVVGGAASGPCVSSNHRMEKTEPLRNASREGAPKKPVPSVPSEQSAGQGGAASSTMPPGCSAQCLQGTAHSNTLHRPMASTVPPRRPVIDYKSSTQSVAPVLPGTRFQTFVLTNYYYPVVKPLSGKPSSHLIWVSQTNGTSPSSPELVASGLDYHFCSRPEAFRRPRPTLSTPPLSQVMLSSPSCGSASLLSMALSSSSMANVGRRS